MKIEDEDLKRQQAISDICGITRHGVVDGVEFDLRHELLDPLEWQMDPMIDQPPYLKKESLPFIWFPWYGEFSKDRLRQEANLNYDYEKILVVDTINSAKEAIPETPFQEIDFPITPVEEYIKIGTPECIIRAGDRIFIRKVNITSVGDSFEHDHDSELRYALLSVARVTGTTDLIQTPIKFIGATSLLREFVPGEFFDKIYRRICRHFQVQTLKKGNFADIVKRVGFTFASKAALHAHIVALQMDVYKRWLAHIGDQNNPLARDAWKGWNTADQAAYVGYLWAKAEAELELKPLARSALRAKAGATSGGAKSGVVRRQKRATSWEPIARQMAKDIRADNPTLSQDALATEIDAGWKAANCRPPGHPTLKGLISRMEKAGELPKRRRI
jgi:hypothetical protein